MFSDIIVKEGVKREVALPNSCCAFKENW